VDRLNAWFGGYALTARAIDRLLRAAPSDGAARPSPGAAVPDPRPALVLDVGGGRGDLARRLVRRARRAGRAMRVVVVDRDAASLALGDSWVTGDPEPSPGAPALLRVRADAAALPFREGSVDVATCSLLLHHLAPDATVACLAAMREAARAGVVVNDLWRARLAVALVRAVTWLVARHPFSRHDGPLSVRRAYAPRELRVLCEKAGWNRFRIRRHPWLLRVSVESGRP
jgi:SAM-dependent methyltransferase